MRTLPLQPCRSLPAYCSSPLFDGYAVAEFAVRTERLNKVSKCRLRRSSSSNPLDSVAFFCNKLRIHSAIGFCSPNEGFDGFSSTQLPESSENDEFRLSDELELREKPNPVIAAEDSQELAKIDNDDMLEPFLKFLKPRGEGGGVDEIGEVKDNEEKETEKIKVEYYEPKPGDFVVGVVVSGNENKLDVNIGADMLGTLLTKDVLPLYAKDMDYLLCDLSNDAEEFMVKGKMGIVKNDDALNGGGRGLGRPVVDTGAVLFAEVLGRTLSGRPLLSARSYFRRIAWHRVRQIKQLNEPIEVKITEWNTGGLLTRIEGLRAFLPKAELVSKVNTFTELKGNVGRRLYIQITRINEEKNDLILSEKAAWELLYLREGTLLQGTVLNVFPYGAQVRLGKTNRSGLLHITKISRSKITSVSDVLKVDDKVKVLVIKSLFANKIALSIADLESEPGLFLSNKERVFTEAEEMAKKYRETLPSVPPSLKSEPPPNSVIPFNSEESLYANWRWFKFEKNDPLD